MPGKNIFIPDIPAYLQMKYLAAFIPLLALISCNEKPIKEYTDTPTTGAINIGVDETYRPIIDSQLEAFHYYYKNAKVTAHYLSEGDVFKELLLDSVRMIVAARTLNEEEIRYFESLNLVPRVTKIAYDAIALITHGENPDSVLTYEQVRDIFNGKITDWKQLGDGKNQGEIRIVFDNNKSGTARYMKENLLGGKEFPSNCFATNTNEEVINYCNDHPGTLGIIGVNWISDGDDPASLDFLKKIKVIAVEPADTALGAGRSYKPYQAYIAQQFYPFTRTVYIISRDIRSGLASGLTAFIAGDKGQRIILKSGIMPATKPVRIVGFRNNE
jgi:phosphate transport system substrate-binding protein